MLQHPPEAGAPATDECPDCGTVVGVLDERNGKPRRYAVDPATGRHGEVMPLLYEGSKLAFLRPVDGGVEWTAGLDTLMPCDRDGAPLTAENAP